MAAGSSARPAVRADAEDLEQMAVDREVGVPSELPDEVADWTTGEGYDVAAVGADEVVAVPGETNDVCGMAIGLEDTGEDVDGGEDLEGAVDGGTAKLWVAALEVGYDLLGGEGSRSTEDGLEDGAPGAGDAVAVLGEERSDGGRGGRRRRYPHHRAKGRHAESLAQGPRHAAEGTVDGGDSTPSKEAAPRRIAARPALSDQTTCLHLPPSQSHSGSLSFGPPVRPEGETARAGKATARSDTGARLPRLDARRDWSGAGVAKERERAILPRRT